LIYIKRMRCWPDRLTAEGCTPKSCSIALGRTLLVPLQPQPLRSHTLDLFIERVVLFIAPRVSGFWRVGATEFLQRFLDG
jgi:hypothetical protein